MLLERYCFKETQTKYLVGQNIFDEMHRVETGNLFEIVIESSHDIIQAIIVILLCTILAI